jgi:transcription initiation factor TFIIIB Brf1 subunit/transcription initiation factor TFIIB
MEMFNPATITDIERMGKKLGLDETTIRNAKSIYTQATKTIQIKTNRITQKSFAVASLYIASALYSAKRISQYELTYKFGISPATIRKIYTKICDAVGIDRDEILESKGQLK